MTEEKATPESQAVVIKHALEPKFPGIRIGSVDHRLKDTLVIRTTRSKDRTTILSIANAFARGYVLDLRWMGSYFMLRVKEPSDA